MVGIDNAYSDGSLYPIPALCWFMFMALTNLQSEFRRSRARPRRVPMEPERDYCKDFARLAYLLPR